MYYTYLRARHELDDENINPMTIPKRFGIKHIPNLLETYFRMELSGVSSLDLLDNYIEDCRKRKKAWQ